MTPTTAALVAEMARRRACSYFEAVPCDESGATLVDWCSSCLARTLAARLSAVERELGLRIAMTQSLAGGLRKIIDEYRKVGATDICGALQGVVNHIERKMLPPLPVAPPAETERT